MPSLAHFAQSALPGALPFSFSSWNTGIRRLSWGEIMSMQDHKLSFLLKSVYDVLPTPTNLCVWGLIEDPVCTLCRGRANLEHILSPCKTALADGRYIWCHDRVLAVLADGIERARKRKREVRKGVTFINFIRKGETATGNADAGGILSSATDWQMQADMRGRTTFPQRPDIVLWSTSTRQVAMLELTVPWEERLEEIEISGAGRRLQRQQLESVVSASGSRMQGICGTIIMENSTDASDNGTREKEDHNSSREGGRTVDTEEEGGEVENIDIV